MIKFTPLASGSSGNAYHVTDGHTELLLEAGIRYKEIQKYLNFQTRRLFACLITHEHTDHTQSIKDVLRAGVDVYLSEGTKSALGLKHHRLKILKAKKQFQLGTFRILPFDVEHDAMEPIGFLIESLKTGERLLFATDTYYVRYKFRDLTHIAVECNYALDILNENIASGIVPEVMKRRLLQSHFSLENVKEFLKANDLSKLKEIHLLHLSDTNSDELRFKHEIQELTGKPVYIA